MAQNDQLDPLSPETAARLIDLLPKKLDDPIERRQTIERIEGWRHDYVQESRSGGMHWSYRNSMDAAADELTGLGGRIDDLLAAVRNLGPLASDLLRRADVGESAIEPDRSGPAEQPPMEWVQLESVNRLAATAGWLQVLAKDEADSLRATKGKDGPPFKLAERGLVLDLADLWRALGGSIVNPDSELDLWPFSDFVYAVGKTIDPDFKAEQALKYACRFDLNRRLRAGEAPRRAPPNPSRP